MTVVGAAALSLAAGCTPLADPSPRQAKLDHIVMVLDFDCGPAGEVSAHVTGTRIVLSTAGGRATYTGAYPTYFGHDSSISFAAEYASFVLTEPGGEEVCLLSTARTA